MTLICIYENQIIIKRLKEIETFVGNHSLPLELWYESHTENHSKSQKGNLINHFIQNEPI